MNTNKTLLLLALAVLCIGVGTYFWTALPAPQEAVTNNEAPTGKYMGIEAYVKNYISDLSPIKEQLGGTFYVTTLEITSSSTGTVAYEDGHNAYTADFTYTTDPTTHRPAVTSFTVRK